MDLTDIGTVRRILQEYQTFAQKRLGQHFLVSADVLDRIIAAAQLTSRDEVLEIGPGFGTLTRALAQKAGRVVAVEKDIAMIKACQGINADLNNIQIVQDNALNLSELFFKQSFLTHHYKLVANLPYYLTSVIIRFFLSGPHRPDMMVLMVQKEVAERIVATPPDANLLSVAVQFYGHPEIITIVPKQNFWPMPKVDSAVIRITPHQKPYANIEDNKFFRLVKAGFGERRKQIHNSLAGGLHLEPGVVQKILTKSRIEPTRRAQTLTIKEWIKLYKNLPKK